VQYKLKSNREKKERKGKEIGILGRDIDGIRSAAPVRLKSKYL